MFVPSVEVDVSGSANQNSSEGGEPDLTTFNLPSSEFLKMVATTKYMSLITFAEFLRWHQLTNSFLLVMCSALLQMASTANRGLQLLNPQTLIGLSLEW